MSEAIDLELTDDQVMRFTQRTRKRLVEEMTSSGMPTDPKDRAILLSALADMDRQALTNKRINGDAKNAEADRVAATAIARMYSTLGTANPFMKEVSGEVVRRQVEPPAEVVDAVRVVPGETEIGLANLTYNSFTHNLDD